MIFFRFFRHQDKGRTLKQRFKPLLFFRKKVAKSSVQGLRNGTPLLKTDHFGDPTPRRRLPHGLLTLVTSVSTSPVFSSLYLSLKHAPKANSSSNNLRTLSSPKDISKGAEVVATKASITFGNVKFKKIFNYAALPLHDLTCV